MIEFFDEQGNPAATVAIADLKALSALTADPDKTLEKLGIQDETVKEVLAKIAKIANSH
jgi:hypothetical protein